MFCSNCGKELAEGAKFCGSCGAQVTPLVKMTAPTSSNTGSSEFVSPGILRVLMTLAVVWSIFSGFVPMIEGSVPFTLKVKWNFFNIRDDFETLERMGVELGVIEPVSTICMGAYILGGLFALHFLYKVFLSADKDNISGSSRMASLCPLISTVIMVIGQGIINKETSSYMLGLEFLSVLPTAWISIAVAAFNVFILIPAYKKSVGEQRRKECSDTKECRLCHTVYIGEECPKCGSVFTER